MKKTFCKVLSSSIAIATAIVPFSLFPAFNAEACTRLLWNNKVGVVVGRTTDWPVTTEPVINVFPRGISRNGGQLDHKTVVAKNPLKWTSKYGSMVTTMFGVGTVDGFNERGLGAHLLYLTSTDFGTRDTSKPGLQAALWAQYALDSAATVSEALMLLDKIQPVMVEVNGGTKATVHLALEDAAGDSAIVEYINGKAVVYHNPDYRVVTNDPSYDKQLALLKKLDFSNASRETPLPGNVSPTDRFQRASYYLRTIPEPKTDHEAVSTMLSVARNVSVPFGAPYKDSGQYNTEYRTVSNLAKKRYYFEMTTSLNVVWADLNKFNLAKGAPVMFLKPDNFNLTGDVTAKFQKVKQASF
ncbi:linear amide C-N hydrolase [Pseudochrobactrum sp. B5]|uniref:linear amide C-N hydrolase n=1 Tax=Pseudochrobactrum sp. B5 TaxID=1289478 RepID=UPI000951D90D|nr:linear amide C-N hydrolase [Pseudochrobactrum sp. B5]